MTDTPTLRRFARKAFFLAAVLACSVQALQASGVDDWEQSAANQFTKLLSSVAFGNGGFVAVGGDGQVATSPDGDAWTSRNIGYNAIYRSVIFAEERFLAVGSSAPVMESSDGVTWTPNADGTLYDLYGVAYGNGVYVAVGYLGKIYSSTDGKSWTQRVSGTYSRLHSVTYGDNLFVACGLSGTVLTSPDGVTWTKRVTNTSDGLFGITFGDGVFVAVSSKAYALASTNGIDWTSTLVDSAGGELWGATWGNGLFVIVGYAGNNPDGPHLWTSVDGTTWTRRHGNVTRTLNAVAYGANRFVAVGDNGTITRSGLFAGPSVTLAQLRNVRRTGANIVIDFVSQTGASYEIQRSTDLLVWTPVATVIATGPITTRSEPMPPETRQYLRVREL